MRPGQGATREQSRDSVTEEQRGPGPKMGLPGGPGRFWAAPASLIASILRVCALFAPWLAPKSPPANWVWEVVMGPQLLVPHIPRSILTPRALPAGRLSTHNLRIYSCANPFYQTTLANMSTSLGSNPAPPSRRMCSLASVTGRGPSCNRPVTRLSN